MAKGNKVCMTIILLLLLVVSITGCAGTGQTTDANETPSPVSKPTPIPIPMVRITVQLVDVFCGTKQNAFGFHDQFYMLGTFVAPGAKATSPLNTQSQLFQPLDITSGQDLSVPQSPLIVFDGVIPEHGSIKGGFLAFNDNKGLAWSNINTWVAAIAQIVGDELLKQSFDTGSFPIIAAAAILDLAAHAWYGLADIDSGSANKLGEQDLTIHADGPPSEDEVLDFSHPGIIGGIGSWSYTVRYHITRTLVTNTTSSASN